MSTVREEGCRNGPEPQNQKQLSDSQPPSVHNSGNTNHADNILSRCHLSLEFHLAFSLDTKIRVNRHRHGYSLSVFATLLTNPLIVLHKNDAHTFFAQGMQTDAGDEYTWSDEWNKSGRELGGHTQLDNFLL